MPRRRGEYSLSKSASYAVLPGLIASDICAAGISSTGACKTTFRLNLTANDGDLFELTNDSTGLDTEGNIKAFATPSRNSSAKGNTRRGALFRELFYRKSKEKENGYRTPVKVKPQERSGNGYYRTPSCDSTFRLPYHCPLEKMRIRTPLSTRRYSKQPPVRVLSFVSLLPEAKTVQYAGRTGSRTLHSSYINDAFVNSQEWTLSRGVPELKLGVVGSLHSGKTSLVHRYLTGAYTSEESPEGGRFKKEVVLDGQSYLLLIRDEGSGVPEYQFAQWVDAVIFVFSLESQDSFETVLHYYNQMAKYRNLSDVPILLVGTQDAISESNPRVIDEHEGRQMAKNLPRCGYYETCSTYGLNVERVFKDGWFSPINPSGIHEQYYCLWTNRLI